MKIRFADLSVVKSTLNTAAKKDCDEYYEEYFSFKHLCQLKL